MRRKAGVFLVILSLSVILTQYTNCASEMEGMDTTGLMDGENLSSLSCTEDPTQCSDSTQSNSKLLELSINIPYGGYFIPTGTEVFALSGNCNSAMFKKTLIRLRSDLSMTYPQNVGGVVVDYENTISSCEYGKWTVVINLEDANQYGWLLRQHNDMLFTTKLKVELIGLDDKGVEVVNSTPGLSVKEVDITVDRRIPPPQ